MQTDQIAQRLSLEPWNIKYELNNPGRKLGQTTSLTISDVAFLHMQL